MSKTPEDVIRDLELAGLSDDRPAGPLARSAGGIATRRATRSSTTVFVLLAVILIAAIGSIPLVSLLLYPFSLFVTLVHESWHALVTAATGGSVASLRISPDLSGQLESRGGIEALIASAGYVGAAATGALTLAVPLRFARWVIAALAAVPLIALAFFHPASLFTAIWCVIFLAGLGLAAWKLSARLLSYLQIFLGAELALNSLRDLLTLFLISGSGSHMQTDATNMSHALFGPSIMWSLLWGALSIILLSASLYHIARGDLRRLRGE